MWRRRIDLRRQIIKLTIQGLQEAQRANQQAIAAVSPRGGLGRAVQTATAEAQRYAISITHVGRYARGGRFVGGGALRSSHRMSLEADGRNGARGAVFIDPSAVNPLTGQKPERYGGFEHKRGYPHNFYERTVKERGAYIGNLAVQEIARALP